jgi:hypothetical protein
MKTFHEFDPVIYPYKLWIIVSDKPDTIIENFLDTENNTPEVDRDLTESSDAFTYNVIKKDTRQYGVVIQFNNTKSIDFKNVAHEATHAAKLLFDHISADIKPHEPFEYVVGWIAKCCGEVKS